MTALAARDNAGRAKDAEGRDTEGLGAARRALRPRLAREPDAAAVAAAMSACLACLPAARPDSAVAPAGLPALRVPPASAAPQASGALARPAGASAGYARRPCQTLRLGTSSCAAGPIAWCPGTQSTPRESPAVPAARPPPLTPPPYDLSCEAGSGVRQCEQGGEDTARAGGWERQRCGDLGAAWQTGGDWGNGHLSPLRGCACAARQARAPTAHALQARGLSAPSAETGRPKRPRRLAGRPVVCGGTTHAYFRARAWTTASFEGEQVHPQAESSLHRVGKGLSALCAACGSTARRLREAGGLTNARKWPADVSARTQARWRRCTRSAPRAPRPWRLTRRAAAPVSARSTAPWTRWTRSCTRVGVCAQAASLPVAGAQE